MENQPCAYPDEQQKKRRAQDHGNEGKSGMDGGQAEIGHQPAHEKDKSHKDTGADHKADEKALACSAVFGAGKGIG